MKKALCILIIGIVITACHHSTTTSPTPTPTPTPTPSTTAWTALTVGSSYSVNTICNVGSNLFVGTVSHGVLMSSNNGLSWTKVNTGLGADTVSCQLFANGSTLYLASQSTSGGSQIFSSTNNGTSWTAVWSSIQPTGQVFTINFFGSNIFVNTAGSLLKSTDNGNTWSSNTSVSTLSGMASDGTNLYAAPDYATGLMKSTDNGATWNVVSSLAFGSFGGYVTAIGTSVYAIASSTSGAAKSTNGGTSWTAINSGLSNTYGTNPYWSIYTDGTNLYAGGIGQVFTSTNGGTSWSQVGATIGTTVNQINIKFLLHTGGNLYAIGNQQLYKIAN